MTESKTLILKKYCDEGHPSAENFDFVTSTVHVDQISDDDIVIQVLAMSADPYLRGHVKSPVAAKVVPGTIGLGQPMNGFIAGKIIASKNNDWVVGDLIGAALPFSTIQVVPKAILSQTVSWKLTGLIDEADISLGIGILGMPGSTAYGGLDVLKPKKGETIFISAAAGIVGGLVGMLMK